MATTFATDRAILRGLQLLELENEQQMEDAEAFKLTEVRTMRLFIERSSFSFPFRGSHVVDALLIPSLLQFFLNTNMAAVGDIGACREVRVPAITFSFSRCPGDPRPAGTTPPALQLLPKC
jgi:hypothetical protein